MEPKQNEGFYPKDSFSSNPSVIQQDRLHLLKGISDQLQLIHDQMQSNCDGVDVGRLRNINQYLNNRIRDNKKPDLKNEEFSCILADYQTITSIIEQKHQLNKDLAAELSKCISSLEKALNQAGP